MDVILSQIDFGYGKTKLLDHFDLHVPASSVFSILGSSGSGKTSILRLIAGLEVPDKGRITLGDTLATNGRRILVPPHRRRTGFVFQDGALWPHMNVAQNILFGLRTLPKPLRRQRLDEMLVFLNLENLKDRMPHQLSGGQQQLTALARALAPRPHLLLLDEPLAHIDAVYKEKILRYLTKINRTYGTTIIYVTHNHREAFFISHSIAVLRYGKIVDQGTVKHLQNSTNPYVQSLLRF